MQPPAQQTTTPTTSSTDEPLAMTVHSLPSPQELANPGHSSAHNRLKLLAIAFICSLPVIVSYYAYFVVRPEGRAAYGELISPARPLPEVTALNLDGVPTPLASLKKQWLLVAIAGGACPEVCTRELYVQRQLRETLGKDKARVDRVWLVNDDVPVSAELRRHLGDLIVLRVNQATLDTWLGTPTPPQALTDHFYLVDPMGNAMMRMAANMDRAGAAKARRDMERLLRATVSWDEPGR